MVSSLERRPKQCWRLLKRPCGSGVLQGWRMNLQSLTFEAGLRAAWPFTGLSGRINLGDDGQGLKLLYRLSYLRWALFAGLLVPAFFAVVLHLWPALSPVLFLAFAVVAMPMAWFAVMAVIARVQGGAALREMNAALARETPPEPKEEQQ